MTNHTSLIQRLTDATEGSRDLDARIHAELNGGYIEWNGHHGKSSKKVIWHNDNGLKTAPISGHQYRDREVLCDAACAPHYTTSIDAALTLVPEGYEWYRNERGYMYVGKICGPLPQFGKAATPALALCIAALKARTGVE